MCFDDFKAGVLQFFPHLRIINSNLMKNRFAEIKTFVN
jgi:hypothetical protein